MGDPDQWYPNSLGREGISSPFFLFSSGSPSRLVRGAEALLAI